MNNDILRKKVKELKCFQGISYKELASYLDITQGSFYSWINGHFNLGEERQQQLLEVIQNLEE